MSRTTKGGLTDAYHDVLEANLEQGRARVSPAQEPTQQAVPEPSAAPTPETDGQIKTFISISKYRRHFTNRTGTVSADFARKLERERDEAVKALAESRNHEYAGDLKAAHDEVAKYKAWNEESKANAHRALNRVDGELEEARAEVARQSAVMRDQANELSEARELLREIRDGEVNAEDEADKFLRCHKASKLAQARAEVKRLQFLLRELGFDEGGEA
jgi:hypothetical protein